MSVPSGFSEQIQWWTGHVLLDTHLCIGGSDAKNLFVAVQQIMVAIGFLDDVACTRFHSVDRHIHIPTVSKQQAYAQQDAWAQQQVAQYQQSQNEFNRAYATCLQGRGYTVN